MRSQSVCVKKLFARIMDGFSWATNSVCVLLLFLLLCTILIILISWHTEQAICHITGADHLFGVTYLIFGILGALVLAHESEHVWKRKWVKVPIGILSVFVIYYCFLDIQWLLIETIFCLPVWVSTYGTLIAAVVSGLLVVIGFHNTKRIRIVSHRIPLGNKRETYRIALISDIHLGAFVKADHVRKIVTSVNRLYPDLVVIAGDLIDDDNSVLQDQNELNRVSGEFRKIQSRDGTVFALGNHDPAATDTGFLTLLKESRIMLLNNGVLELSQINIIGRPDPTHNEREPLDNLISRLNPNKATVVVDHNPCYTDEAADQNLHLVLSGHTHAGQFFPATIATCMAVGKDKFYGCHKIGNTHMVVTSGAGFFNLPVRVGTHNEIVEIILD